MLRIPRSAPILLFLLFGLWGSQPRADADVKLEGDHVASIVRIFQRNHILREPFKDAQSQLMLERYLALYDPARLYFLRGDIAQFQGFASQLDDLIPRGNIEPAFEIHRRFLQRMEERGAAVARILDGKMDLASDEVALLDRRKAAYPKDGNEADKLWARRLKLELLEHMATGASEADSREFLRRRYKSAHLRMRQTNHNEVVSMFINAFASTFDPHSSYMTPDEQENFNISLRLSLEGIGATLRWEDGYTIISSIIPGGAAAREASLRTEDKIIGVAQGKDGAFEDARNQRLSDVVKLIRGRRGSIVRLAYLRKVDGVKEKRAEATIVRDKIVLTDREAKGTVFERKRPERKDPYRVGVVELPSFYVDFSQRNSHPGNYKSSFRDVERALRHFAAQNVEGVILDLRDNGGGGLDEAVSLSGLFLEQGAVVVRVRDVNADTTGHENPNPPVYRGPLVVLVNRYSASASEILAGALKDYGRAIIVGDRATFGKGTVQNIINLPVGLGALKTTVAKFYRPGSSSTQNRGVESDIVLPSMANYLEVGESYLENAMAWDALPKAPVRVVGDLAPYLPALAERSRQRQAGSKYFQGIGRDVQSYLDKKKNRGEVTIKQLLAEREDGKDKEGAAKPGAKPPADAAHADAPKNPATDAVLAETMEVLIDYVRMSSGSTNIAVGVRN
jgi:carboxyl-terminal processing protease